MKKVVGFLALILVIVGAFYACNSTSKDNGNDTAAVYNDGVYTYQSEELSAFGYYTYAQVTIEGGKITKVELDEFDAEGKSKNEKSQNGEYVMNPEGPIFADQMKAIADFVVENQGTEKINILEDGKTDTISTASIAVSGNVEAINEALKKAVEGKAETAALKDGTYEANGELSENGWAPYAGVTISGGKITAVVLDERNADGESKAAQAAAGEYVMTEDGPTYDVQMAEVEDYIVLNQGYTGLNLNEEGKTDVVASASISLDKNLKVLQEALDQAK